MSFSLLLLTLLLSALLVWVTMRWPEVTILLLVAVTSGIYDVKRLPYLDLGPVSLHISDLILMILLVVLFVRATAHPDFRLPASPFTVPLVLFVVAIVVSVLNAYFAFGVKINAALRVARPMTYWLAFFPTLYLIRQERSLRRLIGGLGLVTGLFLLGALFPATFEKLHLFSIRVKPLSTAGRHYLNLSRYFLTSEPLLYSMIPVCLALVATRKGRGHLGYLGLLAGLGIWLVGSLSRNYWLTITLSGTVLLLALSRSERSRLVKRISPLLLVGLVVVLIILQVGLGAGDRSLDIFQDRLTSLFDQPAKKDPSLQYRFFETQQGWSQFVKHPFLGLGVGNSYRQMRSDDRYGAEDLSWYAHNAYLWLAVVTGMLGLVPFLWICLIYMQRTLVHLRDVREPSLRATYLGFGVAFLGMMISNLVSPLFLQDRSLVIFPVMMAISETILSLEVTQRGEERIAQVGRQPKTLRIGSPA